MPPLRIPQRSSLSHELVNHRVVLLALLLALLLSLLHPLAFLKIPNSPSCSNPAFSFLTPSVLLGVVSGATERRGMPHCDDDDHLEDHGRYGKHNEAGVGHDEVSCLLKYVRDVAIGFSHAEGLTA
ncbi:uncharacterized protein BDZ83DRAFT_187620 [Colletotrichum acutatum]|uniref:Uncharacterized protein n=1 Tax=Glomerella acutata TaxID=27357 RepID=A0AAD8XJC5_GLOAC|nr:uncharacterized protein BDZ83DRAFT_187620 [Colletotrichum acutatum]KAK1727738.1 hypothetical protein BDZ83DRAFT_187620 [Colletotrichum acutatum]